MLGDVQGVARWLGKELGSTFSSKGSVGFPKSKSMAQQPLVRWPSSEFSTVFFLSSGKSMCMHAQICNGFEHAKWKTNSFNFSASQWAIKHDILPVRPHFY